jgi:hypothetical protein
MRLRNRPRFCETAHGLTDDQGNPPVGLTVSTRWSTRRPTVVGAHCAQGRNPACRVVTVLPRPPLGGRPPAPATPWLGFFILTSPSSLAPARLDLLL